MEVVKVRSEKEMVERFGVPRAEVGARGGIKESGV